VSINITVHDGILDIFVRILKTEIFNKLYHGATIKTVEYLLK